MAVVSSRLPDDSGLIVLAALAERSEACFSVLLVDDARSSLATAARRLETRGVNVHGVIYGGDPVEATPRRPEVNLGPRPTAPTSTRCSLD